MASRRRAPLVRPARHYYILYLTELRCLALVGVKPAQPRASKFSASFRFSTLPELMEEFAIVRERSKCFRLLFKKRRFYFCLVGSFVALVHSQSRVSSSSMCLFRSLSLPEHALDQQLKKCFEFSTILLLLNTFAHFLININN